MRLPQPLMEELVKEVAGDDVLPLLRLILGKSNVTIESSVLKKFSTKSMTKIFFPTIMQVAFLSVNWGLKVKPSLVKKLTVLSRSLTGKFTKICFATS